MVCKECQECMSFKTNDCSGSAEFNKDDCGEIMKKKKKTDTDGCH